MSQAYSTSNPFRRKGAPSSSTSVTAEPTPVIDDHAGQQADAANIKIVEGSKKTTTKKVRVQSPHPPSPSDIDTPTALVGGDSSIYNRVPTATQQDDDPFENAALSDTSSEASDQKPSQAPPNPFKKTLETMESSKREAATSKRNTAHTGRASLDVEAFKRLLMTGNAGPGITAPHLQSGLGDGGSSTDASSLSRHSLFETIQEQHLDSPSTPHEISEAEDDRRRADITHASEGKKKPLPPSSRHGRLIKADAQDEAPTGPAIPIPHRQSSIRNSSSHSESLGPVSPSIRSQQGLDKPLPQAPERTSHDSDRRPIFDIESIPTTTEPPSPPQSIRRKTPPPLPLTRRHSRRIPDSKAAKIDAERLSTSVEEDTSGQITPGILNPDPTSNEIASRNEGGRAPPPPPSRRPASIRGSAQRSSSTNSTTKPVSLAGTTPARASPRPQSMAMDTVSNKRSSMLPPPPPPPRHGDSSRRTSGEMSRKSWDSTRKGSETGSIQEERYEKGGEETYEERPDILADLTKLQREIDALRSKGERSVS